MNRTIRVVAALTVVVTTAVGGYLAGARHRGYSATQVDFNLGEVQTTLQFNHLLEYRKLQRLLRAGCSDGALTELTQDLNMQMGLIADLHKQYASSWADKYMLERDPAIINELTTFKSAYDGTWPAPVCKDRAVGAIQPSK
jgi:hypothetical protein